MKKIKTLSLLMATSLLVASCTSYSQAAAGITGAAIGSHVGRDIGYVAGGGFHHFGGPSSALGSLIGAGIGAALGVGIQNSIERSHERAATERYQQRRAESTYGDDYQYEGGSSDETYHEYEDAGTTATVTPGATTATSNQYVSIESLTYMDGDGDGYISKGEAIEVQTYITNVSGKKLTDVSIILNGADSKYVTVSSPLFTTLAPGQKIKYTGRVYCQKAKTDTPVSLSLQLNVADASLSSNILQVYMK